MPPRKSIQFYEGLCLAYKQLNEKYPGIRKENLIAIYNLLCSRKQEMKKLNRKSKRDMTVLLEYFKKHYSIIKDLIEEVVPVDKDGNMVSYKKKMIYSWGFIREVNIYSNLFNFDQRASLFSNDQCANSIDSDQEDLFDTDPYEYLFNKSESEGLNDIEQNEVADNIDQLGASPNLDQSANSINLDQENISDADPYEGQFEFNWPDDIDQIGSSPNLDQCENPPDLDQENLSDADPNEGQFDWIRDFTGQMI